MDCYTTAGRLRLINQLSEFLPSSNQTTILPNDIALKQGFYSIMPTDWQTKFDSNGSLVDNPIYTFKQLIDFMEAQRLHSATGCVGAEFDEVDRRRTQHNGAEQVCGCGQWTMSES
jgi:hypothetical protein